MIPPPTTYGLPPKFREWRTHQPQAAIRAIETGRRFPVIVAPTGFGKMVVAETIARYCGRSVYMTVNKGLQDQIAREVADRFDIRGKSNYDCPVLVEGGASGWRAKVEQADHNGLCEGCHLKDRSCLYYSKMRRIKLERHVNTNYAKWLTGDVESFGEFDVLICDEAHSVPDVVSRAVRVEIKGQWVEEFCGQRLPDADAISMDEWLKWGARQLHRVTPRFDGLQAQVSAGAKSAAKLRELRDLRAFVKALQGLSLAARQPEGWIEERPWQQQQNGMVAFEPVWPRAYGELLFRQAPKVVLLSATIRPKTLSLVGIAPEDTDFAEYPSSFPVERRPVIPVKTVVMRHGMTEDEKMEAVRRVDQIIGMRQGLNGIVHTHSFDRAQHLYRNSQYAHLMLLNRQRSADVSSDTEAIVEEFKRSRGRVLVTPSVTEGYDFPGDECRWQAIYKVPLLNRHASKVADARCKDDPEYDGYQAMMKVMQICGRGVRSADDWCETLILDDAWGNWFWRVNKRFAAGWFTAAVRETSAVLTRALHV